jgi:hypothetical protein
MTAHTLENLKARCLECGDCHLWQGSTNGAGHPKLQHTSTRRVVWSLSSGQKVPAGRLVTVTCGKVTCVNPDHLALTSKADVSKKTNARWDVKLRRSASSARANREKLGKITMVIARQIRASEVTGKQLAIDLNVSESLVSMVRRNKSWVEHTGNVWAGLSA